MIPVAAVVVVAVVVCVLWAAGVFGQGGGNGVEISGPLIVGGTGNSSNDPNTGNNNNGNDDPANSGSVNTTDTRPTALPPTASPEKTDDPFPTSPGGPGRPEMPYGGEISLSAQTQVNNNAEFTFTPDRTGLWVLYTGNNGGSDPMLAMYEPDGALILQNDDSLSGYNAELTVYLVSGTTYFVQASFYGGASGSCAIFLKPPEIVPASGGVLSVSASQGLLFTPSQSGIWEFRTSENSFYDPFIIIYDQNGVIIGSDDDGAGDKNALLRLSLNAGETYDIYAGFYQNGPAPYMLSIAIVG